MFRDDPEYPAICKKQGLQHLLTPSPERPPSKESHNDHVNGATPLQNEQIAPLVNGDLAYEGPIPNRETDHNLPNGVDGEVNGHA